MPFYKNNMPWNKGSKGLQINPYKKDIPKDILNKLYIEDKLSTRQIGKILKISKTTMVDRLKEHNIHIRSSVEGEKIRISQEGFKGGAWKGGKCKVDGYVNIWLNPNNPFYSMVGNIKYGGGYVREHRLIMAEHLGRPLESWEQIHHKNYIRDDNRIENLEIINNLEHSCFHRQLNAIKKENKELKALLLLVLISKKEISKWRK